MANAEEISVNPADLPSFPQARYWVTGWEVQFVVVPRRANADPYGMVQLSLTLRAGQIPNS